MTDKERKAVPREPTDTMGDAGYLVLTNKPDDDGYKCVTHIAEAVWRAMYDAAPVLATAPAEPPKDGEVAALIERLRAWIASFPHSAPLRVDLEAAAEALARLAAPVPELQLYPNLEEPDTRVAAPIPDKETE